MTNTAVKSRQCVIQWGVKIPLQDGILLSATFYRPKARLEPGYCVCTLTPYIADSHHERAVYFATHGVPTLVVDVRGRGNSEGEFQPYLQEARDAFDVVEWLARQPDCNGQVALCGSSYLGYCQWAAAKEFPPHLAAIVPSAAPFLGVDFPMRNNIFYPYLVQWLTLTGGRAAQKTIFSDAALWSGLFREWHDSGRPFRDLDSMVGNPSSLFQQWLDHPRPDEYWDQHNPTAEQYGRIDLPILTITGSYDGDQPGALEHYKRHIRYASPAAQAKHYLIIGPWDHAGTTKPSREFGGLTLGEASRVDLYELHLQWYAWTLQNGPKPEFLQKRVAYYITGAERWAYADTLDSICARHESYFLDSARNADDVFSSGVLTCMPGNGLPDFYRYDPRDVKGPEVEAEENTPIGALTHQDLTVALRGKQLVYHSAPLETDTIVSGFFRLRAYISIDCPDTDLFVALYAINHDGTATRLTTDGMRARYREGLRHSRLIRSEDPLLYDFQRFTFVAHQLNRGHRLRLAIAPVGRLVETTFVEKNYNSGGVVAEESAECGRAVTVRLFHDAAHPSALHVPVGSSLSSSRKLDASGGTSLAVTDHL